MIAGDGRLRVDTLGPLRAYLGEQALALGPPRQCALFAVLALAGGSVVSRDELIDHVWGATPPATATGSLHTYVSGLRRILAGPGDLLARSGAGYLLRMPPDGLDTWRVERLAAQARTARAAADRDGALAAVEEALACWRPGPALIGLPGPFAEAHRVRCAERQLQLVMERAELLLELGRPGELVDQLTDSVTANPFDERLRALLMIALHRSGRTVKALEEYRAIRADLADELGIDPSAKLQAVHRTILGADDTAATADTAAVRPAEDTILTTAPDAEQRLDNGRLRPAQLPRGVGTFVGRGDHVSQVQAVVRSASAPGGASPQIVVAVGAGGIGKTAFAVHCGHLLSSHFPDGQLFLNLRGFNPKQAAMSTADALHYLLTSLGVRNIPAELEHRVALWRSTVRDRRLLIVLDDAHSTDQVDDLVPGDGPSFLLVTSRNRLGGLVVRYAARRVTLTPLTTDESLELFADAIGSDRVETETTGAKRLAELCDHLPLALRIVGEQVCARPQSRVADLVADLEDVRRRLDTLQIPDDRLTSVRAVLSLSYDRLDPDAARAFRLVGLFVGARASAEVAAALLDIPTARARTALQQLAAQHLVTGVDDRFRMHDLTRLYADEVCHSDETEASRREALDRVLRWYIRTLTPECLKGMAKLPFTVPPSDAHAPVHFADHTELQAWFGREWENIGPLIRAAHHAGAHDQAWQLAYLCFDYFYSAGKSGEWTDTLHIGIRSAEALGDRRAKAVLLNHLSVAHSRTGDNAAAVQQLQVGLALLDAPGDEALRTSLLANLASTLRESGDYTGALPPATEALRLARRSGVEYYEAGCLDVLCQLNAELGDFVASLRYGAAGLPVARRCGAPLLEANILINLGIAESGLDNPAAAWKRFGEALALSHRGGDRYHEALALFAMARLHRAAGAEDRVAQPAREALRLLSELGAEEVAEVDAFLQRKPADHRST